MCLTHWCVFAAADKGRIDIRVDKYGRIDVCLTEFGQGTQGLTLAKDELLELLQYLGFAAAAAAEAAVVPKHIEALAESMAVADGKDEAFKLGRDGYDPEGVYEGYLADAENIVQNLGRRGFELAGKAE
jgi:hypothetical protein